MWLRSKIGRDALGRRRWRRCLWEVGRYGLRHRRGRPRHALHSGASRRPSGRTRSARLLYLHERLIPVLIHSLGMCVGRIPASMSFRLLEIVSIQRIVRVNRRECERRCMRVHVSKSARIHDEEQATTAHEESLSTQMVWQLDNLFEQRSLAPQGLAGQTEKRLSQICQAR